MIDAAKHTFVVCAYKNSPYLRDCIESLQTQTVRTNLLVSTSTPTGEVRELCRQMGIELVERTGASGLANDWNAALAAAHTPLVTIAHQDDVYKPAYSQTLLESLDGVRRPLIFFSNYGELRDGQEVDDNRNLEVKRRMLRPIERLGSTDDPRVKRGIMRLGSSICCPSVTIDRDNVPTPLFQQGMESNLDWEAWESLTHVDGSFVYSGKILMLHRIHEGSETSRIIDDGNRTREDLEMLEKFWPAPVAKLINHFYKAAQKSNS